MNTNFNFIKTPAHPQLIVAKIDPEAAVNKTFDHFQDLLFTGQGLLLLAVAVFISWVAWNKRAL